MPSSLLHRVFRRQPARSPAHPPHRARSNSALICSGRQVLSDKVTELIRLCSERVDLEGEDAVFFQNVMSAILETRHESERQARLEEARVWFDKWRLHETQDFAWASERLAMLQQMVEDKGVVIYMTKEMAETICNLAENDPSVPLIEAKYSGWDRARARRPRRWRVTVPRPFGLRGGFTIPPWLRFLRPPYNAGRPSFSGPV